MITSLSLMDLLLNQADQIQQSSQINSAEKTIPTLQRVVAEKLLAQAQGSYSCVIDISQLVTLKAAVHLLKEAVEKEAQARQFAETSTGKEIITAAKTFSSVADRIIESLLAASASERGKMQALSSALPKTVETPTEEQSEGLNKQLNEAKARPQVDYNTQLQEYLDDEELEKALDYASQHIDKIDVNYQEGILLLRAAEYGNPKLIELLLRKLDKVEPEILLEALREAAHSGHEAATKLLFDCFINKQGKCAEEVKNLEREIKLTTAYDNYSHIKVLFDSLFSNSSIPTKKS